MRSLRRSEPAPACRRQQRVVRATYRLTLLDGLGFVPTKINNLGQLAGVLDREAGAMPMGS